MIIAEVEKRPADQFGVAVGYQNVLGQGEFISSATLQAIKTSDGSDVTASFLVSASGTIPSFTATGGSTTTAVFSSDIVALGFAVGDYLVNQTKGFRARITDIRFGAAKNDTAVFEQQAVAVAATDVISAQKVIIRLKAAGGADGDRVKVLATIATNFSNTYLDELFVNVRAI